jgi:hypothetical protein
MENTLEHDADDNAGPLDRAKLEKELGKFGGAFGKGQNSRPSAALICVDAASRCSDVGPDDAADLYGKFAQAAAKSQGLEYAVSASAKVQVSKLKRFLMLGALPAIDGVDVMNRATDVITSLSRRAENPMKGSAYDNMVLVARRQIEQPTVELTDEDIEGILTETPDEKSALDLVIDLYKKSYRLAEKLVEDHGVEPKMTEATNRATAELAQQISDLGGDLPAMTKDEKALEKAQGTIKKLGGTVSFMPNIEVDVTEEAEQDERLSA